MTSTDSTQQLLTQLLAQTVILDNLVLTGPVRGVENTVLVEAFRSTAQQAGWFWVRADLSEPTPLSENAMATRLLTDLAAVTNEFRRKLDHRTLRAFYDATPGLVADKLRAALELVWSHTPAKCGLVFVYAEAQNLSDQAEKEQFPLSVLLDVFQHLQKNGIRFMLVLVGLPFEKLINARTFAERMFRVFRVFRV